MKRSLVSRLPRKNMQINIPENINFEIISLKFRTMQIRAAAHTTFSVSVSELIQLKMIRI